MKFPPLVLVAPRAITVALDKDGRLDELDDLDGVCDHSKNRIWIRERMGPLMEKDTVLHELLHSIIDQLDIKRRFKDVEKDFEEDVVYALTPRILALLRDNPRLVRYLVT